jgi:HPt (histidine-containing phosphotransfer) domain-containing protein
MENKVIVEVDEELSDLIPGFLARKRDEANAILDAAQRDDYTVISRLAHRIKGEGGSYGFEKMTEIGRALEDAAKLRNDVSVTHAANELLDYLEHLDIRFHPATE